MHDQVSMRTLRIRPDSRNWRAVRRRNSQGEFAAEPAEVSRCSSPSSAPMTRPVAATIVRAHRVDGGRRALVEAMAAEVADLVDHHWRGACSASARRRVSADHLATDSGGRPGRAGVLGRSTAIVQFEPALPERAGGGHRSARLRRDHEDGVAVRRTRMAERIRQHRGRVAARLRTDDRPARRGRRADGIRRR